jgi:4-aminobutyrate aminotransferase-like enzyme
MGDDQLLERRRRAMGAAPVFYKDPVHIVRGEGIWLYDAAGKQYMDCYNNVPCVGHCHPHVVNAMHEQAATLNTHSRYLSEVVVSYSERLMALHAPSLTVLQMGCSGTEAIEVALKMARLFTGGQGIICSNATYHGNSHEVFRMSAGPFEPEYRRVPFPDAYRPIEDGLSETELGVRYVAEVQAAIDAFAADGVPLAAMLFCSIFANEGLPDVPFGYMAEAAALVRGAGGVVIFDEVQAGFCRTGKWWGYEVMDCVPDIVAMGKPMGAGYPLSGVGTRAEIADVFHGKSFYFNTTAATPLQAAVGGAVLDVIENEDVLDNVNEVGTYVLQQLMQLREQHEAMGDVRGHGLFVGVDWVKDRDSREPDRQGAVQIVERMKEKGFLISNAGQHGNVLKIRPPLVFLKQQADLLLTALSEVMEA